jgi:hypothetical protein
MVELDDFKGLVGAENWTQRTSPSSQLSQPTKSTRTTSLCVSKRERKDFTTKTFVAKAVSHTGENG